MRKVFAVTLLTAAHLYAQSTGALLTGRVTDPSKALIVNAKVIAINEGTDIHYKSATNASGEYSLVNLPPGTYGIEVEQPRL
jgi:hypothetical protein